MTESLRSKVVGIYTDLQRIVDKDPSTKVGGPVLSILRQLITATKDSGGDAKLCDAMLEAFPGSGTMSAADAFAIAGQLKQMTGKPINLG